MRLWHIYRMEYKSAVKKNTIMELTGKWMEIEEKSS